MENAFSGVRTNVAFDLTSNQGITSADNWIKQRRRYHEKGDDGAKEFRTRASTAKLPLGLEGPFARSIRYDISIVVCTHFAMPPYLIISNLRLHSGFPSP